MNALAGNMYLKECPQLKGVNIELQMAGSIRQRLEADLKEAQAEIRRLTTDTRTETARGN